MEDHFLRHGDTLTVTRFFDGGMPPSASDLDWLVVMGGPMGVYDRQEYPWLEAEMDCIRAVIDREKAVLGICLGAQLIAAVLGASVKKNPYREIGWFPISTDPVLEQTSLRGVFPESFAAFHWHGDTFDIPEGCIPLGSSEACRNQGFVRGNRVVTLQFHLETTEQSARDLIAHAGNELDGSRFVQAGRDMLEEPRRFGQINRLMSALLEAIRGNVCPKAGLSKK